MDFSTILEPDTGQNAAQLHLVRASECARWRDGLSGAQRVWVDQAGFTAKAGEFLLLPTETGAADAVLGIDSTARLSTWELAPAATHLPGGLYRLRHDGGPVPDVRTALVGWLLSHYAFTRYKSAKHHAPRRLVVSCDPGDAIAMAEAMALVRDMVNTPANDMTPAHIAAEVQKIATLYGAVMHETSGDALLERGYPTVHMVGRAASDLPRVIDLHWGEAHHPRLTLIGKGVSFDSGGLDIKPASAMATMKKDMGGAAHALALAMLVMRFALPVRLRLLIPAVENAISGNAFRPGDIVRTRKGLTVEIGNTDAEGRLILCDVLAEADDDGPDLLIDFATLTGAARIALGPDLPALFCTDDGLADALAAAAHAQDDPLWRLPLWEPYGDLLASPIADLNNSTESGLAGAITAALFLKRFLTQTKHWVHFDIFSWNQSAKSGRPKGGEAMALRTVWAVLCDRYRH